MESIVINKKVLACDIFFAFSANRIIDGKLIQPCVGGGEFTWQVYPKWYLEPGNEDRDLVEGDRFDFSFSRDNVVFRADPNDMIKHLTERFVEFETAYFKSNKANQ